MTILPPGTILQLMYLRERLGQIKPGRFIEVGPGSGEVTNLLLELGWIGQSCDLTAETVERLKLRFSQQILGGQYTAINANYLNLPQPQEKVDLVISCMVIEHLDDALEPQFMRKSLDLLKSDGLMIGLVPSSPKHWGIEDEIAGHYRRYTQDSIEQLIVKCRWKIRHVAGLTFPVSNLLLPISNFLVHRSEKSKLSLSLLDKTKSSGNRSVKYKTHFPLLLGIILNETAMSPLHWLQKIFKTSENSLVIYFEASPFWSRDDNDRYI